MISPGTHGWRLDPPAESQSGYPYGDRPVPHLAALRQEREEVLASVLEAWTIGGGNEDCAAAGRFLLRHLLRTAGRC